MLKFALSFLLATPAGAVDVEQPSPGSADDIAALYVAIAGDTMTGDLTLDGASPSLLFTGGNLLFRSAENRLLQIGVNGGDRLVIANNGLYTPNHYGLAIHTGADVDDSALEVQNSNLDEYTVRVSSADGTDQFVIDRIGDVGLGTATPDAKLDVNGDVLVTGYAQIDGPVTASSGTFTDSGATQYSLQTTSGVRISSGGLVVQGNGFASMPSAFQVSRIFCSQEGLNPVSVWGAGCDIVAASKQRWWLNRSENRGLAISAVGSNDLRLAADRNSGGTREDLNISCFGALCETALESGNVEVAGVTQTGLYIISRNIPSARADSVVMYSTDTTAGNANLFVLNENGDVTQLSSHSEKDASMVSPGGNHPWVLEDRNRYSGHHRKIDLAELARQVQELGHRFLTLPLDKKIIVETKTTPDLDWCQIQEDIRLEAVREGLPPYVKIEVPAKLQAMGVAKCGF